MVNCNKKRQRGFTLLEVMTVVLLIAILLAIAVPGFNSARQRGRASAVMGNLRQIDTAKQQFVFDYQLGPGATINDASDLVPSYMKAWPEGPVAVGVYNANVVGSNPTYLGEDQQWFALHCTGSTADAACPL